MLVVFLICAGTVLGLLAIANWFGAFKKISISEKIFEGGVFYFLDYQDQINNVGSHFKKVIEDRKKVFADASEQVAITGIYYDPPGELLDPKMMRASIGFVVKGDLVTPERESALAELTYKKKILPPAQSLYGQFPASIPCFSSVCGALKFYPELSKFIAENKVRYPSLASEDLSSIEVIEGGWIRYYFPFENLQEFHLTPYAKPERKPRLVKDKQD